MQKKSDRLIWIDLEMTGLNPDRDLILEIATIVTNAQLEIIAEGPVLAIHQPDPVLNSMDAWNTQQHRQSGLTDRVRRSETNLAVAEARTLAFLKEHLEAKQSPMCGNSICQDRRFLFRLMPDLEAFFHYRNLDVSTVKELAQRWRPDLFKGVNKKSSHLALDDIRESIAELRHYRDCFFRI